MYRNQERRYRELKKQQQQQHKAIKANLSAVERNKKSNSGKNTKCDLEKKQINIFHV